MDELTARIDQLESQVRVLRRTLGFLGIATAVVVASCATLGNAQTNRKPPRGPAALELQRLAIVDQKGRQRIVLGSLPDGSAGIAQFSKSGKLRMQSMTFADDSAGSLFFDKKSRRRAGTLTLDNGDAGLLLRDKDGTTRLTITTKRDGSAGLDHYDRKKRLRVTAGTTPDNQGNVLHYDTSGIKRVMGLTTEQGAVAIGITDRQGTATWAEGTE